MWNFLKNLKGKVALAIVGGSDLKKIIEQLNCDLTEIQSLFDFIFTENGLVSFKGNEALPTEV